MLHAANPTYVYCFKLNFTDGELYYFRRLKIRKIGHHQLESILHFYD